MSFDCQKELCKLGITNDKTFRKWSVKGGHPDKGGDGKYYAKVSDCRDKKKLCKPEDKSTAKKNNTPANKKKKKTPANKKKKKTPANKKKKKTTASKKKTEPFQRDPESLCALSLKTLMSFPLYKKTVPYWQKSKKKKKQLCNLLAKPESQLHDRSLPKRRNKTKSRKT